MLLAKVIEVVTKKPYGQFLADRIFNPLSMRHTKALAISDLVHICLRLHHTKWKTNAGAVGIPIGALATVRSGNDFCLTWPRLDIGLCIPTGSFDQSTLSEITTPQSLNDGSVPNYAMGWKLGASRGVKSVGHDGPKSMVGARVSFCSPSPRSP